MNRFKELLLLLTLAACSPSQPEVTAGKNTPSTEQRSSPANGSASSNVLARTWVATGITFNGVADPNFDPARRVELVMLEDGTYTMSGAGNAVEGTWRQEGSTELHLTDKITGSLQRFGISKLDEQQLVVKLLDEMNAEVLLHYRAEQGPAVAR